MAQLVKNSPAMQKAWVQSQVGKIPWRRERLPTPIVWPGEFHGLYSSWCCKELDMTEQLSLYTSPVSAVHSALIVDSLSHSYSISKNHHGRQNFEMAPKILISWYTQLVLLSPFECGQNWRDFIKIIKISNQLTLS